MKQPLAGIRVLDVTGNVCGPYCTQILGDLGAEIIKVEPPEGDVSRGRGTFYAALNRNKKSITLNLHGRADQDVFISLAKSADIIAEDLGPHVMDGLGLGYAKIRSAKDDIIYVSITGYGHDGIFSKYSDADAIVQALSGIMSITGEADGPFTKVGFPIADVFTGIYAAIAAMSGLLHRKKTGKSLYADVAKLAVMLSAMPDSMSKYMNTGKTTRPNGGKHQLVGFFQPTKTRDGYVVCMAEKDERFRDFVHLLGLDDLAQDERFNSMYKRRENSAALEQIIQERTQCYTTQALMKALAEKKVPAGPVYTLEDILADDYVRDQQLIIPVEDHARRSIQTIGFPIKFNNAAMLSASFLSQPGAFTDRVIKEIPVADPDRKPEKREQHADEKPLAGVRILDLTRFMAGPLGVEILENLGAEVIKIERINEIADFARSTEPTFGTTSAYFVALNGGKRDVALDLKNKRHHEIALKLAEQCDVFTENFRPGVTERLGLTYPDILRANPTVVYSSVSGFGQSSAYSRKGCADVIAQAMSGLMSLTGTEDAAPIRIGSSVADVCASLYEAVGILAALIYRDRTGESVHIDIPMMSAMLAALNCEATAFLNEGAKLRGTGNRDRTGLLFQTYPASNGEVMVDITSDAAFSAFAALLGLDELKADVRFDTTEKRNANAAQLEPILNAATRRMTMSRLADLCRKNGVPAGEAFTQEQICRSGYLEDRKLIKIVRDSEEGSFKVVGLPIRFDRFNGSEDTFTPQPGEDTYAVLKSLLGMQDAEIDALLQPGGQ